MRSKLIVGGLLASIALVPALAQSNPPATTQQPAATAAPTSNTAATHSNVWRASKLKGLDVYNEQNEKLGDINEILLDKSGKVEGVVIGVGGFLGMGQHDIKVEMSKLKFVDEPVRTSSTATNNNSTTGTNTRASTSASSTASNANDHKWYPDHAILSGASKDQLKSMPQFKYD
jgi:sporulation protein YlmC with PRC-barrel domain